jgi:enoyl-CoA hydratase/carnithine racemase
MTVEIGRPSAHVAEVIMNRPEAMNALSTEQLRRLGQAATQLTPERRHHLQRARKRLLRGG